MASGLPGWFEERWKDVLADVEATAAEYRESGWEAIELHPADVTPIAEEEWFGLDVLVGDGEFEELEATVDAGRFDSYEVYRAEEEGMVFLLTVLEDPSRERAVLCPAYYEVEAAEELRDRALEAGGMYTHVRRLSDDYVTFTHEDPGLFFPDDGID